MDIDAQFCEFYDSPPSEMPANKQWKHSPLNLALKGSKKGEFTKTLKRLFNDYTDTDESVTFRR